MMDNFQKMDIPTWFRQLFEQQLDGSLE